MARPMRVVFVRGGTWGTMKKEDYDSHIETMRETLVEAKQHDYGKNEDTPVCTVEVVDGIAGLEEMLGGQMVDVVFFFSRGIIAEARQFKKAHPHIRVIVLTGLVPDDEITILDKRVASAQVLTDLVL